jgi:hypothetical protein
LEPESVVEPVEPEPAVEPVEPEPVVEPVVQVESAVEPVEPSIESLVEPVESVKPESVAESSVESPIPPLETSFIRCKKETQKNIGEKWKHLFPSTTTVINYKDELAYCTFEIIFDIIKKQNPETNVLTINQLKEILIEEYNKYSKDIYKIGRILYSEGKTELAEKILSGEVKLDIAIMSDNYYITNLDLLLIAKHFNLPIVLLSSRSLQENKKSFLITNKSSNDEYYFILTSPAKADLSSPYKLFYDKTFRINLNRVNLFKSQINKKLY